MASAEHAEDKLQTFGSEEDIPDRVFLPKDYIGRLKRQVSSLLQHVQHVLEDTQDLDSNNSDTFEWNDLQLASVYRDTVWHKLSNLKDCEQLVQEATTLLEQKIRESMGMVATDPDHFGLNRVESGASIATSEEEAVTEEVDEEEFQDVDPVRNRKKATALNDQVSERVRMAMDNDEDEFNRFKQHAFDFGTGNESAEDFYDYLLCHMREPDLRAIIFDFARLLPQDGIRIPLLKAHYEHVKRQRSMQKKGSGYQGEWTVNRSLSRDSSSFSTDDGESDDENSEEYPSTLRLKEMNHLVFVIHGIGQHIDFKEGELKSWNGRAGLEGGNHAFRDMFRNMLETQFRDVPLALEMQSIEWHEDLHDPTGVDSIFDLICPEGASGIREFNKETLMDVMYYLSPHYGQLIVDSVTQQLNQKYQVFLEEHPGWDGKVSIFAHSLGSVISYDLLTHEAGEVSSNGIKFSGLDFEVDNFFGAGSPVPVMILARGDLDIQDGVFTPGIRLPKCRRYFNIIHPIDPIAYRVEPLIQEEMHDKAPVQLLTAHSVKSHDFPKIQQMYEELTSPIHGFPNRLDYVLKRRAREQGMMEIAFAASSHSSYWLSEDVVLFCIMQLCQPVVDRLHRYMSARQPMPKLMRSIKELTPYSKIHMSANALIRERCTGFSHDLIVLMDKDRLHILPRVHEVACRRRWRIQLTHLSKAVYGDDSFTLKIVQNKEGSSPPRSSSTLTSFATTALSTTSTPDVVTLKAPSTPVRDEWMDAINQAVVRLNTMQNESDGGTNRGQTHLLELPQGLSIDYFGAIKVGFLQERTPKNWYEGWTNRWIVVQDGYVSGFEGPPRLEFTSQFKLRRTKVLCYDRGYLFRVVASRGTSIEMRVRDQTTFDHWLDAFNRVPSTQLVRHKELVENSPSAVLLMTNGDGEEGQGEWIQTKIEGYRLAMDDKGVEYAAFVIHVATSSSRGSVVQRRYSEFNNLHRQLKKMFTHEQIPALPGTRFWNKLEHSYLKEKAVALHTYLNEVCKRCANTRAEPILLEFLELKAGESFSQTEGGEVVAGRNGGGKSCIVDAIAFCFGASVSHLRVKRLADLINDKAKKEDSDTFASVEIALQDAEMSGKALRIERRVDMRTNASSYSMQDGDSVSWKRCTYASIQSALMEAGIDISVLERFVIRQTNATTVAKMSSNDLLTFYERIVGTMVLRQDVEGLQKQYNDLDHSLSKLRGQKESTEQQLQTHEPVLNRLDSYITRKKQNDRDYDNIQQRQYTILKSLIAANEQEHAQAKIKMDRQMMRLEDAQAYYCQLYNQEQALKQDAVQYQKQVQSKKEVYNASAKDYILIKTDTNNVEDQIKKINDKVESLEGKRKVLEADKGKTEKDILALKERLVIATNERVKYQERRGRQHASGPEKHENELKTAFLNAVNAIQHVQGQLTSHEKAKETNEREVMFLRSALNKDQERLNKLLHDKKDISTKVSKLQYDEKEVKERCDVSRKKLSFQTKSVIDSTSDLNRLKRQLEHRTSQSEAERAVYQLQSTSRTSTIYGFLSSLANVDSTYSDALNSVLHHALEYVVVENRESALDVSYYFATHRIGRVQCCITDELHGTDATCSFPSCGYEPKEDLEDDRYEIPLCSVVRLQDESFRPVFHQFCRDWTIRKTDRQYEDESRTRNYVSLKGDLFFSDGVIRTFKPGGRKRRVMSSNKAPIDSDDDIQKLQREIQSKVEAIAKEKKKKESLEETYTTLRSQLQTLTSEINKFERDEREIDRLINQLEAQLDANKTSLHAKEEEMKGLSDLQVLNLEKKLEELKAKEKNLKDQMMNEKEAKDMYEEMELEHEVQKITTDKETLEHKRIRLETQLEETIFRQSDATNQVKALSKKQGTYKSKLEASKKKKKETRQFLNDANKRLDGIQERCESVAKLVASADKTQEKMKGMERKLRREVEQYNTKDKELTSELNRLDITSTPTMEESQSDYTENDREILKSKMDSILEEAKYLERMKASLSEDVLEEAVKLQEDLASIEVQEKEISTEMNSVFDLQKEKQADRFNRLMSALPSTNEALSDIYHFFNEYGECYLDYPREMTTLFSEGITFLCKPDESFWQPILGLSGGQQTICAVSMLLALQASFQCPLYICDELDAALDTKNVRKLGQVIHRQSQRAQMQFLIVSHRPEMWDCSEFMIGVYHVDGSATTIPCYFN